MRLRSLKIVLLARMFCLCNMMFVAISSRVARIAHTSPPLHNDQISRNSAQSRAVSFQVSLALSHHHNLCLLHTCVPRSQHKHLALHTFVCEDRKRDTRSVQNSIEPKSNFSQKQSQKQTETLAHYSLMFGIACCNTKSRFVVTDVLWQTRFADRNTG